MIIQSTAHTIIWLEWPHIQIPYMHIIYPSSVCVSGLLVCKYKRTSYMMRDIRLISELFNILAIEFNTTVLTSKRLNKNFICIFPVHFGCAPNIFFHRCHKINCYCYGSSMCVLCVFFKWRLAWLACISERNAYALTGPTHIFAAQIILEGAKR